MEEKTYIAIDLKSFYASVECMDRGAGSHDDSFGSSRCITDGKDHLSGSFPIIESLGHPRTPQAF